MKIIRRERDMVERLPDQAKIIQLSTLFAQRSNPRPQEIVLAIPVDQHWRWLHEPWITGGSSTH